MKLKAYDGGSATPFLPPATTAPRMRRTVFDSSRMPDRPANQNLGKSATELHCQGSFDSHDGNGDVLDLFDSVRVSGSRAEALHPGVGDTIHEDDRTLDHLGGACLGP